MINRTLPICGIICSLILSIFLVIYPEIDMKISALFYNVDQGFFLKRNGVVLFFYRAIPYLTKFFVGTCLVAIVFVGFKHKSIKKMLLSGAFFLFISAVISPGIVVNSFLKEYSGRARPREIVEFAGVKQFSPAFIFTNQCERNCSFPSGHSAMGFYFTALAYVASSIYFSRIYMLGLVFGSFVGLTRVIMGGHFASDVVASCLIVLFCNHIIFLIWKKLKSTQTE